VNERLRHSSLSYLAAALTLHHASAVGLCPPSPKRAPGPNVAAIGSFAEVSSPTRRSSHIGTRMRHAPTGRDCRLRFDYGNRLTALADARSPVHCQAPIRFGVGRPLAPAVEREQLLRAGDAAQRVAHAQPAAARAQRLGRGRRGPPRAPCGFSITGTAYGSRVRTRHSGRPAFRMPSSHLAKSSARRVGKKSLRLDMRKVGSS